MMMVDQAMPDRLQNVYAHGSGGGNFSGDHEVQEISALGQGPAAPGRVNCAGRLLGVETRDPG